MHVRAIYPGTFDPLTNGHHDVAKRACMMFDELVIGVAASTNKQPYFDLDERVELVKEIMAGQPNVTVRSFDGLLVEFAREVESKVIIRGLRAISDFEFEVQIAGVNRHLDSEIETVFIAASQDFTFLSSSIVREISKLDGDVSSFVHPIVLDALARKKSTAA